MTSSITQITRGELACWQVHHRGQTLVVAEQGAQVLEYRRDDEPPILWLSEEAAYQRGKSVRGGVPVCWPWFGALALNPESVRQHYTLDAPPAHGLVRDLPWQLTQTHQDDRHVRLVFQPESVAGAPPVSLSLVVTLDDGLSLSLENQHQGSEAVTLSQALHSYFAVSDSRRITLQGLEDRPYVDALDDWRSHRQAGPMTFTGETDRLYLQLGPQLHIDDPDWGRRITLTSEGSHSAVVWNPWIDKARRLGQFADDAWQRMLCIETARVLDDVLLLAPRECHTMGVRIVTTPL